jgi:hypothetical protein
MEIETYLQPGDHVQLGPRSTLGTQITGILLAVNGELPGDREFVILKDGDILDRNGAVGIPERDVVIKVERGDCWINLGPLLTLEQARVKCDRSEKNQARKNVKDFPLFSDQAPIVQPSAEEMVSRFRAGAQEDLERDHAQIMAVNALRDEAAAMIPADQYQMLLKRRAIYPHSPEYGRIFWKRQIAYISEHGCAEPPPTFAPSIASQIGGDFKLDGTSALEVGAGQTSRRPRTFLRQDNDYVPRDRRAYQRL